MVRRRSRVRIPLAACKTPEESGVFFHINLFPHVIQPTCVLKEIHEIFPIFPKPFAFFHRIDFFAEMGLLSLTDVLV